MSFLPLQIQYVHLPSPSTRPDLIGITIHALIGLHSRPRRQTTIQTVKASSWAQPESLASGRTKIFLDLTGFCQREPLVFGDIPVLSWNMITARPDSHARV